MLVGKKGANVIRVVCWAFTFRPSIIGSRLAQIDFFPSRLSNVIDENAPSLSIKGKRERIAQAIGPDGRICPI